MTNRMLDDLVKALKKKNKCLTVLTVALAILLSVAIILLSIKFEISVADETIPESDAQESEMQTVALC